MARGIGGRLQDALKVLSGGARIREASFGQAGLIIDDPDISLDYNQGGALYYRPLTDDPTRDLRPIDIIRMQQVSVHLFQSNPWVKRLIERRTNYVLGGGVNIIVEDEAAQKWVDDWRRRDKFDRRIHDRTNAWRVYGEWFAPVSVNPENGAVRTGYLTPELVSRIRTKPGQLEEVTEVIRKVTGGKKSIRYRVIAEDTVPGSPTQGRMVGVRDGEQEQFTGGSIFYWQANALPVQTRGLSDIWCIADYCDALEQLTWDMMDGAALRNSYWMHMDWGNLEDGDLHQKAGEMGQQAPKSGSMLHTNKEVKVTLLNPNLGPGDAGTFTDMMLGVVATGGGAPDYWLNAQLDPNRASAEAMAVPIIRDLEEFQRQLRCVITDEVQFVIDQAVLHRRLPDQDYPFTVEMPPLGEDTAVKGGTLMQQTAAALVGLRTGDDKLLDRENAVRVVSRVLDYMSIEADPQDILDALDDEKEEAEEEAKEKAAEYGLPVDQPLPGPGQPQPNGQQPPQNGNGAKPPAQQPVPAGGNGKAPAVALNGNGAQREAAMGFAALLEHLPGQHDQSAHGHGGALDGNAGRESRRLRRRMMTEGGFTYEPRDGVPVRRGWVVAPSKSTEQEMSPGDLTDKAVAEYIDQHIETLRSNPRAVLGGWYDKDGTGKVYLDVSEVYDPGPSGEAAAIATAVKGRQYGIFELGSQSYHEVTKDEYRKYGGADWEKLYNGR